MEEEENGQVDIQSVVKGAILKSVMGTAVVFAALLTGAYFLGFIGSTQVVSADASEESAEGTVSWKDGAVLDGGSFASILRMKGWLDTRKYPTALCWRRVLTQKQRKNVCLS